MHTIQEHILHLLDSGPIDGYTLRGIADRIGEDVSAQSIKHHLEQLVKKGLIRMDTKQKRIEKIERGSIAGTNLISIPIYGSANCGEALEFADNHVEGFLKVSKRILGSTLVRRAKELFVVRAVGQSMNQANIDGAAIADGDYVIVDKSNTLPKNGDYVLSLIDGVANIKKFLKDASGQQIMLVSESYEQMPPIYIHADDMSEYLISGTVVRVMKQQPNELDAMRSVAARDTLAALGPMSDAEDAYYRQL